MQSNLVYDNLKMTNAFKRGDAMMIKTPPVQGIMSQCERPDGEGGSVEVSHGEGSVEVSQEFGGVQGEFLTNVVEVGE